jgi:ElaB/YqjD/DUF883 family membrane-anchored ribosome-binding protein
MNDTTTTEDPAAIEREIRRTQDNMSRTVDKIGDQLSIKNLFNALLDKADENNVDARMLVDGARRNPIALGLIAAGAIWLVSDKDSKIPSLGSKFGKSGNETSDSVDTHHRDYVSHMSTVEQRADEDAMSYQRRRDTARSNFLMVERNHDEDESSFRQRLNGMTDKFREKRDAWADTADQAQTATKQTAQAAVGKAKAAVGKAQDLYAGNPLVGGILAAAVGAAFGSALPITDQEKDKLGSLGEKARDVVSQQTDQVTAQVREKKDDLLDKADAALQKSPHSTERSDTSGIGDMAQRETPFMAGR